MGVLFAGAIVALPAAKLAAQPADSNGGTNGTSTLSSDWPLESVTLSGGQKLHGLIEPVGPSEIEFIAVHRPPGKPMYLIVTPIDRKSIASWQRLDPAQRKVLRERIEKFRNRAVIEARRMEDVQLTGILRDRVPCWLYRGEWFALESTADEQTTRRSIVRIEQMFTAYRQILPPRVEHRRPLQIMLFGATDQYQQYLRGLGLEISNPAFFAADFNLVAAGSDMNQFVAELAKSQRENLAAQKEFDRQLAALPERLKQLSSQLRQAGRSKEETQTILAAEQKRWDDQKKALAAKIAGIQRRNTARFNEVAGQMFARLYHEAFHAYLDGSVYPSSTHDVPRWLNEGLAQVFEGGLLEADTLRLDAPNKSALSRLRHDLAEGEPLALADLVAADANTFLLAHRASPSEASRWYLYSWGLAYYLTFEQPVLGTPEFDEYIRLESESKLPVERFEKLVGMPLDQFEGRWRETMLHLGGKKVARSSKE